MDHDVTASALKRMAALPREWGAAAQALANLLPVTPDVARGAVEASAGYLITAIGLTLMADAADPGEPDAG